MSKLNLLRKLFAITTLFLFFLAGGYSASGQPANNSGNLKIVFINTANGKNITLRDSSYVNPFGEEYFIKKLKYYIGNVSLPDNNLQPENPYYLVNAASEENSISLPLKAGKYSSLSFLLGVDSASNCSGAQSGALDPANDMFWTWNSGYIMFKLDGNSPASTSDLQRIEHHIGGYKANNNVATRINLDLSDTPVYVLENKTTEIIVEMNLDKYWRSVNEIKISETPVVTTPGVLAKKMAANFSGLFSVKNIHE